MTPRTHTVAIATPSGSRRRRGAPSVFVAAAAVWLVVLLLSAVFAETLPLAAPDQDLGIGVRVAPFEQWPEFLGTDSLGRSVLARIVFGARASLEISVFAVATGFVIGGALGLVAGYARGVTDTVVGTLNDALLAFPGLVFLLSLAAVMGRGVNVLVLGLAFISVPVFLRIARANAIRFASREFVHAARLSGARLPRVLAKELLPNVLPPMVAYAVIVMATLIVLESSLSYLGLGVPPPVPSWGGMIADGQSDLRTSPALVFVPAAVLFLTVLAFNALGDWVQTRMDVVGSKV